MPTSTLILPGFGNSGAQHWQTLWEVSHADFARVHQRDWYHPVCADWVAAIEQAVTVAGPEVILVTHSLACLALAHWSAQMHSPIKAALLVAVPDPASPCFPATALGFEQTPTQRFTFPSIVVTSSNDPFGSAHHAEELAIAWGSQFINIGACGHINADSNLGAWETGFALLEQLRR